MRKGKVLFIGMTPGPGGLETFMVNLFSKLNNKFSFFFINLYGRKNIAYSSYIKRHGGRIINLYFNNNGITKYIAKYIAIRKFFYYHHDFDVIHLNLLSLTGLYWLKEANKYNIPCLIVHSHNDSYVAYRSKIKLYLAKLLIRHNQNYLNKHPNIIKLAASYSCGKWMFNDRNFEVIPNGINVDKFKFNYKKRIFFRNKLDINYKDKVIITVARMAYQKNYEKIIRVFYLVHNIDSSVKLVIIGDGPDKYKIIKLIKKLQLTKNVLLLGTINNVNDILNIADLMLMPSRYEGFPFALVEAQSSGVPALVSYKAIPNSSNITGYVKYLSLHYSDKIWSKKVCQMLYKPFNINKKMEMNEIMKRSKYNMNRSISSVKRIYSNHIID